MKSAIYSGWVRHRRYAPRPHAFRYRLFMVYLDLAELEHVFAGRWLWGTHGFAPARFVRSDHFGDPAIPLERCVRDLVEHESGRRPGGPIRLLTHLRYFGHCFNPVSFYYCFDAADTRVDAIVAEVTNTPWGERHCYVLSEPGAPLTGGYLRYRTRKAMHVSPFMPMELEYRWCFSPPDQALSIHMALHGGDRQFDATMRLERSAIGALALARTLVAFPLMTLKVVAAIHWEALRLWFKRIPIHDHPRRGRTTAAAIPAPVVRRKRS